MTVIAATELSATVVRMHRDCHGPGRRVARRRLRVVTADGDSVRDSRDRPRPFKFLGSVSESITVTAAGCWQLTSEPQAVTVAGPPPLWPAGGRAGQTRYNLERSLTRIPGQRTRS